METKNLMIGALALACTQAGAAVTVTLTALDLNTAFNSSLGTTVSRTAPLGNATETHSFTVSNLDIAEDGSADDTVVFSYDVIATGGTVALVSGTAYAYGVNGASDANDNEIDPGEGLSFRNLGISVSFGTDPSLTAQLDSAVFDRFVSRFPGGGDVLEVTDEGGNTITPAAVPNGGPNDPYVFTGVSEFNVVAGAGGNGFGIDTVGAQFTLSAVPEPSSIGLLALSGVGVLVRRRR